MYKKDQLQAKTTNANQTKNQQNKYCKLNEQQDLLHRIFYKALLLSL